MWPLKKLISISVGAKGAAGASADPARAEARLISGLDGFGEIVKSAEETKNAIELLNAQNQHKVDLIQAGAEADVRIIKAAGQMLALVLAVLTGVALAVVHIVRTSHANVNLTSTHAWIQVGGYVTSGIAVFYGFARAGIKVLRARAAKRSTG